VSDSGINSLRRFYLLKRITAKQLDDLALSAVWHSKQEEQPGTELPADFPLKTELAAIGYTADTDLDGADADELMQYAGLTQKNADAVISAFEAL
jgi:hypothetical protein